MERPFIAPPGTVAYDIWLGRSFPKVLLNTRDQATRAGPGKACHSPSPMWRRGQ